MKQRIALIPNEKTIILRTLVIPIILATKIKSKSRQGIAINQSKILLSNALFNFILL